MRKQQNQTVRTFIHSVLLAILIAAALDLAGRGNWAAGFAIGSALSLFSLYSLKVCVPALFHAGAPRYSSILMQVVLLFKVPLYAIALYLASRLGTNAMFAAFAGCTLVPCVISIEAIVKVIVESNPALRRAAAMRTQAELVPAVDALPNQAADGREPLPVPAQTRAVREGAL